MDFKIDSHKLIYHPSTVSDWIEGKNIFPIEMEIGLSGGCNHRCIFCAVDYMNYEPIMLKKEVLIRNLRELAPRGLKSIIYAGEGEPLLNKNAPDIINETKSFGIDTAMSTNGVLFDKPTLETCLKSLAWVRYSVSAIKSNTYKEIHKSPNGDLEKVLRNIEEAVRVKKDRKLKTTLGVQLLLFDKNRDEVVEMAKVMRDIGVDYFTIKPFSFHPESGNKIDVDYSDFINIKEEVETYQTEDYKILFRANAMQKLDVKRSYKKCYGLPFMAYIDSKGDVWPCIVYMGKEHTRYGNINESSFIEIWESDNRKRVIEYFDKLNLDENCRDICRLDEINKYLWELKNPNSHVNFI